MDNDQPLLWTDLYNPNFYSTKEYEDISFFMMKRGIEYGGSKFGTSVKIYSPELVYLFKYGRYCNLEPITISAANYPSKVKTRINGDDYFKSYSEGYREGELYWESEFAVHQSIMYGANGESYVNDIYNKYYFINIKQPPQLGYDGWEYVKRPLLSKIITHKFIREYGYYSGIVSKVDELVKQKPNLFAPFEKQSPTGTKTPAKKEAEQKTLEPKPTMNQQTAATIYEILKEFFNVNDQAQLKIILATGYNASEKLLFKSNGNKLTDTFKKLIENSLITGCQKKDLQTWIVANFQYVNKKKATDFNAGSIEQAISRQSASYTCKNPLIEIQNGEIQRTTQ